MSGAALQGLFRNPLVGAQIVGISNGAAWGGVLAILLALPATGVVASAFLFGLAALAAVFGLNRLSRGGGVLSIVLAGVIVSAFFSALVGLAEFLADPERQLAGIVYWLLGSFAGASSRSAIIVGVPTVVAGTILVLLRWRINVLRGDTLELGPYVGAPTEHTRIKVGVGVCGSAVAKSADMNVADVTAADNYLACSLETQSELVVLIRDRLGRILGQIDIDSHARAAFGVHEQAVVTRVARELGDVWPEPDSRSATSAVIGKAQPALSFHLEHPDERLRLLSLLLEAEADQGPGVEDRRDVE